MLEPKSTPKGPDSQAVDTSAFASSPTAGRGSGVTPFHTHNGQDSPRIPASNLAQFVEKVRVNLPGATAAEAANYGVVFIADQPCTVVGFQEAHQADGTDGGAVTLQLEKLADGEAAGTGQTLLPAAISLKADPDEVQVGVLSRDNTAGVRDATLRAGDRLALKKSGTLTAVSGVTCTIFIQYP